MFWEQTFRYRPVMKFWFHIKSYLHVLTHNIQAFSKDIMEPFTISELTEVSSHVPLRIITWQDLFASQLATKDKSAVMYRAWLLSQYPSPFESITVSQESDSFHLCRLLKKKGRKGFILKILTSVLSAHYHLWDIACTVLRPQKRHFRTPNYKGKWDQT